MTTRSRFLCILAIVAFSFSFSTAQAGPIESVPPTEKEWTELEAIEAARELAAEIKASGGSVLNLAKTVGLLYLSYWIQQELFD